MKNHTPHSSVGLNAFWKGFLICGVVMLLCSIALWVRLLTCDLLSGRYLLLCAVALLVLNGLIWGGALIFRKKRAGSIICGVVALVLSAGMVYGVVAVDSVYRTVAGITDQTQEGIAVDLIVLADDPAKTLEDTASYTFGLLQKMDWNNTLQAVKDLEASTGIIEQALFETPAQLADALYSGQAGAILLNAAYIEALESMEGYEDFSQRTRVLHSFVYQEEITLPTMGSEDISLVEEPFAVYLSGSDARATGINVRGRSDSNILAVVNPQTRQILLVNTPRDYYVRLNFNGEMDKLTHAGIYGISESIHTLEDLYGISIEHYARINFYGLIDLVDAVGGIDVYSEYELTLSSNACSKSGDIDRTIRKGMNHFDGAKALAFSRERYNYSDGDNQRGKNQMAVIQALLEKMSSASVLLQYQQILNAVSSNTTTSFSYEELASLAKWQLEENGAWNIQTYAVTRGPGSTSQPCYSLGGAYAWVMPQDEDSVNTAKELIQTVLSGELLPQE